MRNLAMMAAGAAMLAAAPGADAQAYRWGNVPNTAQILPPQGVPILPPVGTDAPQRWNRRGGGRWIGGVRAPGGWAAYRRPQRGWTLPHYWMSPNFFLGANFGRWGLFAPPQGYFWVRYYDDAVLVDRGGRVWDWRDGIDWDDSEFDGYGGASANAQAYAYSQSHAGGGGYGGFGPGYPPQPGYPGGSAPRVYHGPPAAPYPQPGPPPGYGYQGGYHGGYQQSYQQGGYYQGGYAVGGYWYPPATTTTIVVQSAPVVTTVTEEIVTETVTTYTPRVRRRVHRPRAVRRAPRPAPCDCRCVCR